ncbi:MAG: hypothetical protein JKP92_01480 [Alphaproteobacteria bacterium]|jgi:hypothetical protein|nr:hypothetical protein [Alphaproteobacteria bacterium]
MTKPENTGAIQADGRFRPGQSGNPKGKPKGARNKATLAAQALLEGEAEGIARKAVELAKVGDVTALRLCLERVVPGLKSVAPCVAVDTQGANSLTGQARALVEAALAGEVAPDVAAQLVQALGTTARVEEVESLRERLEALERAMKGAKA